MSHFTVLVIGDEIEKALAPFQENNMGDCPKEYLRFRVWPEGSKDGQWFNSKEEAAAAVGTETAEEGYWDNPNKRWDWYSVGGRWTGFFKMKDGGDGELGHRSFLASEARPGYVDSALKSAIDLEATRNEAGEEAGRLYDLAVGAMAGTPEARPWAEIRDANKEDIEKARTEYHAQPRVRALAEFTRTEAGRALAWDSSPEDFAISREEYVQRARNAAVSTHAVIKDGQWCERGKMGWFGCVSDEKDKDQWLAEYAKMIDALPEDTRLTVVDCHI